jgi:outer membrane murein-binding lipoprotein Lpp
MKTMLSLLFSAVVAGSLLLSGCSNRYFRNAVAIVGEDAALAALESSLVKAGITSADHMTDAVRLVVDNKDYGGAFAAFAIALEEHNARVVNKLTSGQAIALMRLAEPTVRSISPAVANALESFCNYANSHG